MEDDMSLSRLPKISLLAMSIYTHLGYATDLNLDFIQGTGIIPSILKSDYAYPQGQYSVDVFVNNEKTGTAELNITPADEKNNMLCFSPEWINSAGVMLDASKYDDVYNREKNCYELAKKKSYTGCF